MDEEAIGFDVAGERLQAILHRAVDPAMLGALVVVGGPQYRVGSHRQFVLLARALSAAGFPVLRFDYRGMGDSTGEQRDFEAVSDDIRAAVDLMFEQTPTLRKVVIWGLCDAASAACFYAPSDARVSGLVLLNPWVRTIEGEAKAYIRHYYLQRVLSGDFWRKLLGGKVALGAAARSFLSMRERASGAGESGDGDTLPERMYTGLRRFGGRVMLILSGEDLTAAEFRDTVADSKRWQTLLRERRFSRCDLAEANHTFSRREWRDWVAERTREFLDSLNSDAA